MEYEEQNEQELDLLVLIEDFVKIGKRFWALLLAMLVAGTTSRPQVE